MNAPNYHALCARLLDALEEVQFGPYPGYIRCTIDDARIALSQTAHSTPMPDLPMFRTLGQTEEEAFRLWARDNYQPLQPISGIWHPIVQDECAKINAKATVADALS